MNDAHNIMERDPQMVYIWYISPTLLSL